MSDRAHASASLPFLHYLDHKMPALYVHCTISRSECTNIYATDKAGPTMSKVSLACSFESFWKKKVCC